MDRPTGADYANANADAARRENASLAERIKKLETVTIDGEDYYTVDVIKAIAYAVDKNAEMLRETIRDVGKLYQKMGIVP